MQNNNINSTDFKKFLSEFFDKDFNISEEVLLISEKYLFDSNVDPRIGNYPDLEDTLTDLKDIIERNNLKNLNGLVLYYENKWEKIDELFKKLEETDPEEFLAIDFQQAITMYTKAIKGEQMGVQLLKSTHTPCLYYLHCTENSYPVDLCIPYRQNPYTNIFISYSHDDEVKFLTQVKGNLLVNPKRGCDVSEERTNELVSN